MVDIGKKIKDLLKNANISQSAFAIEIGVHYQSVSKWERNLVTPDLSTIDVIIKYFDISFESFFEIEREDGISGCFSAENLSHAITLIRKNASLIQSEFAIKIDTNIDKISKWERGVTLPSIEEILCIAKEFNLPPSAVYYGSIEKKSNNSPILTIKSQRSEIKKWLIASCTLFSILIIAICISVPILVTTFNSAQKTNDNNSCSVVESLLVNELGYCQPISNPIKLHGYQEVIHQPTINAYGIHEGLDIVATYGENVYSMITGEIFDIAKDSVYGWKTVSIVSNDGLTVIYRYCAANEDLKIGDLVTAGDIIGTVTKVSFYEKTYPVHLHVEVYLNGVMQDPEEFFTASPPETNYEQQPN